ncbi:aminotransferase class III-fold pyridoxal phosphate-dependent enzyme [Streptomyces sp. NPDC002265]|uniref:aminotransferase class III-fold pyridoxal phosphate-dependent enzyme n=1 Tax=Streptomyces sp. NPDC002265 TaxID=3154415 RepID=UPI00332C735B
MLGSRHGVSNTRCLRASRSAWFKTPAHPQRLHTRVVGHVNRDHHVRHPTHGDPCSRTAGVPLTISEQEASRRPRCIAYLPANFILKRSVRGWFGPLLPRVVHAPYEDRFVRPDDGEYAVPGYLEEVVFTRLTSPNEVAAVVMEPVLGEGGYVSADPEWLLGQPTEFADLLKRGPAERRSPAKECAVSQ